MRIALVCPYAWDRVGGVQSHVQSLSRALGRRGHDVTILAPRSFRERLPRDETVSFVGRAVGLPANGSIAPISFGPLAAVRVRRELARLSPDVVHLHEPLIPSLSLLALWSARSPAVGTFHAASPSSFGYRAARPLLNSAAGRLAARTAVSDAARRLANRYFPGDYALTPNGVDVGRFARATPLDLEHLGVGVRPKVLFLSRIERRKGLEVLIQAMARLRDVSAVLLIAGEGPEERSCRALAKALDVETRWLGRLAHDDVPRAYRAADVYCAPGLGGESFGIVLVEAMAAGAPIVCSDLEGFAAVAGGAAALVPPGDPGRLAEALRAVLTDEREADRMRKMSARMAGMFDWSRLVAGIESIYERAVNGRPKMRRSG